MTQVEKINLINEALVKCGSATKYGAKAELREGKVFYSRERQNATSVSRIKLSYKEILWMMDSRDAQRINKLVK